MGDEHDPNLAPIAAYSFGAIDQGNIDEDGGRFPLKSAQVISEQNARIGAGNSSAFIAGASLAWADQLDALARLRDTGFALEVLPKGETGGTLVNLGQGAQSLSYADMRFTYSVRTVEGTYTLSSEAIFPGRWYQVAARYAYGKLELWVNGDRYEQIAQGDLVYHWSGNLSGDDTVGTNHDLVLGGDFNGNLDNLKWYDWTGSPLMTFSGGATQTVITLDSTQQEVPVIGTGKLHEPGGELGLHRVAIHTDKVRQYASLMSLDTYKAIAGSRSESIPLDQQTAALPLSFMFPQAHAGFWSGALDVVSFFLLIQEIGIVLQQLSYAVSDPDKFEADTFIVNLIVAATYLPPGRVLQPFAKTLGTVFRTVKKVNPKFLKYFGGMFKGIIARAKKGEFDTLWHMLPFFITLAEMYNDEDARKGLEFIFKTVNSGEDVLSWIDYLSLPSEGWDGSGDFPSVSLLDTKDGLPVSWLVNQAYAAPNLKRIVGVTFGKTLAKVSKLVAKGEEKYLPDALKTIKESLGGNGAKAIAEHLFSPSTLRAAIVLNTRAGAKSLKNFAKGNGNARYKFPIIAGTLAYLGWEMTCGALKDGTADPDSAAAAEELQCGGKGFNGQVSGQIAKKLALVFSDAATGSSLQEEPPTDDEQMNLTLSGQGHGALFHLVQTAYYQIKYREAGGLPVKFLEKGRYVAIIRDETPFKESQLDLKKECKKSTNGSLACINFKLRYVDIVLGNGEVKKSEKNSSQYIAENAADQKETWIELKSWEAKSESDRETFANEFSYGVKVPWVVLGKSPTRSQKKMIPCTNNTVWIGLQLN